jgi:hypothetical protein
MDKRPAESSQGAGNKYRRYLRKKTKMTKTSTFFFKKVANISELSKFKIKRSFRSNKEADYHAKKNKISENEWANNNKKATDLISFQKFCV